MNESPLLTFQLFIDMSVLTENEQTTKISAATLFNAFVIEPQNIIPKALPQAIQSLEIVEGDGGAGTIRKIIFANGKSVTNKIDSVDKENLTYTYTLFETDASSASGIEKIVYETKFVSNADGGCTVKSSATYHGDIDEEGIKTNREKAAGLFKAIEAYLTANPDA